jgi:hypothetical protein
MAKENGRLPAIAGLARVMQPPSGAAYMAGLRRDTLAEELLWYPASDNKRSEDNDLRAPSRWRDPPWTWAALNGAVRFGSYFEEDFDIEVISCIHRTEGRRPVWGSQLWHGHSS